MSALPPTSRPSGRIAVQRGALYFIAWTVVALTTTELQYIAQPEGTGQPYGRLVRLALASCWLWALFTPLILALARRFRIDRTTWPRTLPLHLVAAALLTLVDVALMREIAPFLQPESMFARTPLYVGFLRQLFVYSVCYFVVAAFGHVQYYAVLSHERDLRAAQLEAQLASARLAALQGQLRPHFLFNTLNMIAEQVYTDPAGADAMLTRLGVLLRSSFVESDRELVPLRRELELLESYVDIMRGRFRSRLTFDLDVDPSTLDALVPRFVLQPLVENAVKHGVEPREEGGRVTVTARRRGASLALDVCDNGDGLIGTVHEGTGVRNTRERLLHLYGPDRQRFALTNATGGGTVASLEFPYETDDGPASVYTTPRVESVEELARREMASTPGAATRATEAVVGRPALGRPAS